MRVAEPSYLPPLPSMQWVSSLFSAVAFNAVGELSLLGRSGTVIFLDFSLLKVMVFGFALKLETCYDVAALSYLLSTKTVYPLN